MRLEEKFNQLYDLLESKEDWDRFEEKFGTELTADFKSLSKRLPVGERSIYDWLKRDKWELEHALADVRKNKTRSQQDNEARSGAIKIDNSDPDKWTVLKINTIEASKKYGANTKWCVSGTRKYANGRTSDDVFHDYVDKQGMELYFIINKKNGKKYAALVEQPGIMEIWDAEDKSVKKIPNAPRIPALDNNKIIYRKVIAESGNYQFSLADKNVDEGLVGYISNSDDEYEVYSLYNRGIHDQKENQLITIQELCNINDDIANLFKVNSTTKDIYDDYDGKNVRTTPERLGMLKYGNLKYHVSEGAIDVPDKAKFIYIDGGDDGVIPPHAFENSNIEFVYLFGVKVISEYAFANCKKLFGISNCQFVEKIESNAFKNCKSLYDVYFWETLENGADIAPNAFTGARFEQVTLPPGLSKLKEKGLI